MGPLRREHVEHCVSDNFGSRLITLQQTDGVLAVQTVGCLFSLPVRESENELNIYLVILLNNHLNAATWNCLQRVLIDFLILSNATRPVLFSALIWTAIQ